ncbi:MAG: transglutaminaseTgpA domain-containing protein [Pseudohongiellaceae bacterium]
MTSTVLARPALQWLLVTVAAALLPHLLRLPWWLTVLLLGMIAWRHEVARRAWRLPGALLRFFLVFACITLVIAHYGLEEAGVDIFVALLAAGSVLRVLETRTVLQARQLCVLTLVVLASGFIYDQSIPAAVHAFATAALVLLTLQALLSQHRMPALRDRLYGTAALLMMATPLMLVLFLGVPRIGPLWAMPAPNDVATSGVSDELAPGGITGLGLSDELAFRVGSEGSLPSVSSLYWRGLALDRFDGSRWQRSRESRQALDRPSLQSPLSGEGAGEALSLDYELIMEPSGQRWVYALQPVSTADTALRMDRNRSLYAERPVIQRERYRLSTVPGEQIPIASGEAVDRQRALRLPGQGEPRSRELAAGWRSADLTDRQRVEEALDWFGNRPFVYTLEPPEYGEQNGIDAFLFDEQAGFCGHFASAFAYLMRAAGVPARVVVGYQGGERNPYEDYLMVYQYNAHAWVEVWLEGQGWTRVDPTATVAPERIELGAEAWLQAYGERTGLDPLGGGRNNPWLNALRLRLDSLNYAWNRWVINFDSASQFNLLESLTGQRSEQALRRALTSGLVFVTAVLLVVVLLYGQGKRRCGADRLLHRYGQLLDTAIRRGSQCRRTDGPLRASASLAGEWPSLGSAIREVSGELVFLCYGAGAAGRRLDGVRRRRLAWRMRYLQLRLAVSRPRTCTGCPVAKGGPGSSPAGRPESR